MRKWGGREKNREGDKGEKKGESGEGERERERDRIFLKKE